MSETPVKSSAIDEKPRRHLAAFWYWYFGWPGFATCRMWDGRVFFLKFGFFGVNFYWETPRANGL